MDLPTEGKPVTLMTFCMPWCIHEIACHACWDATWHTYECHSPIAIFLDIKALPSTFGVLQTGPLWNMQCSGREQSLFAIGCQLFG